MNPFKALFWLAVLVSLSAQAQTNDSFLSTPSISTLIGSYEALPFNSIRLAELGAGPCTCPGVIFSLNSQKIALPSRPARPSPQKENQTKVKNAVAPPTANPERKLDPFLRYLLLRTSEPTHALSAPLNLASYANLVAVYEGDRPLTTKSVPLGTLKPFQSLAHEEIPQGFADRLGVLIKTQGLPALGGVHIDSRAGDILTARVTLDELKQLASDPAVKFIQAGYKVRPTLDESVPAVNGDKLHAGKPAATGKGVLIGIVDTGLDYDHLDFRYDNDGDGVEESSRILYMWDQTETNDQRTPKDFSYGTEYTRAQIEKDIANDCRTERGDECLVGERDEVGHGTHVTGIAAGDGSAAHSKFIGMAPDAEIIFVKTTYFENQIIDAVKYIFDKAERLGHPVVVNLSLGGHFGPHDGTSGFEQGLNELLGRPGQIIVASAGNEGNDLVHAGCRFFTDCRSAQGLIGNTASYRFVAGPDNRAFINFWYPPAAIYTVTVISPGGLSATASTGQSANRRDASGELTLDNASSGPDPRNGLNPLTISLDGVTNGSTWTLTIQTDQDGGRFDGWPGLASMGHFEEGDTLMTISEPANAPALIAVGAYTTKEKWDSIQGKPFQFQEHSKKGELAVFSSHGPTRDGRLKPDLTAPGTAIISTLAAESQFATEEGYKALIAPDGQHSALQGTSMAAPHVTGAIAMMLQSNPRLTAREAFLQLKNASYGDQFTRVCPALKDAHTQPLSWCWGAGKLEALKSVDTAGFVPAQFGQRPQVKVGPNPAADRAVFFYTLPPRTEKGDPVQSVDLIIYDITGRIVHRRALSAQGSRAEWDLADDQGKFLPNGLYIFILTADGIRSDPQRLIVRHR